VKAVNLLPGGGRQAAGGGGLSLGQLGPVHVVLGVLVVLLAYVTVYVLTGNAISQRQGQLAALNAQLSRQQAQVARLSTYTEFQKLAQQRAETVRQIAAGRFDWHGALSDLSKVMPASASLQSLLATVATGASVSGAGGSTAGGGGSLRSAINAPAFELKGCARSQDDVARLVSRLRLVNDVQRVTLEDSTKAAPIPGASTASSSSAGGGCSGGPSFDAVVFFQALPGAAQSGGTSPSGAPAAPTAQATQTSTSTASSGAAK
jgi:Tfp pilus assembly protein PilN